MVTRTVRRRLAPTDRTKKTIGQAFQAAEERGMFIVTGSSCHLPICNSKPPLESFSA